MLAPNQVSAPAAIHTSSMPANVGAARLTSDGCTKIDEPTIVPTTIAVACVMPIDRVNFAVTGACYHRTVAPPRQRPGLSTDRLRGQAPQRIDSSLRRFIHRANRRNRVGLGRGLV